MRVSYKIAETFLGHLPSDRAATKAVVMLLAQRMAAWSSSTPPREMAPKHTAARAARKPTTVAWTWSGKHIVVTKNQTAAAFPLQFVAK